MRGKISCTPVDFAPLFGKMKKLARPVNRFWEFPNGIIYTGAQHLKAVSDVDAYISSKEQLPALPSNIYLEV
jgi:hypothetical protein